MILLIAFAFLAGIITILSPCILPILPVVLSGSVLSGKRKPFGIVTGFIVSFTVFTLFLATIVKATGVPADILRNVSIVIIFLFGLTLLLPQFQVLMEKMFSQLSSRFAPSGGQDGFFGGILIGLSLGLIWTPCVGPIIASVITLAATSDVTFAAFFITFSYSLGTAIPMFAIMMGGRGLLQKNQWLLANSGAIQKAFGVLMILTAVAIFFNIDRKFQTYILDTFPQYGQGLTSLEDNDTVNTQLDNLFKNESTNQTGLDRNGQSYKIAPELIPGGKWFNTEPLTMESLRGKVVLVDFWTYTCINCIRTLPYLRDWHAKYEDDGLVIIGVHTPEFAFEHDSQNVQKALEDFDILYPVMQDNDYATWDAYANRYWPAKYLVDKNGNIRYTHFGEGAYDETEKIIQELLAEDGTKVNEDLSNIEERTPKARLTPETYLGSWRMELYYPNGNLNDGKQTFELPKEIPSHSFSFGGEWTIAYEYSMAGKGSILIDNFYAERVFLVMRPPTGEGDAQVRVYLDGKIVTDKQAGLDVDPKTGIVTLDKDRLYELVNLNGTIENHLLWLEFLTPGIEVFAFTFG